jgi:HSP20 family molecular chaperone IbpA
LTNQTKLRQVLESSRPASSTPVTITMAIHSSSPPILEYVTSNSHHHQQQQQPTDMAFNFAAVRFAENDRFIRLALDLPGVLPQDLIVELQQGVLVIRGARQVRTVSGHRRQHKFCRRFAIDTDVVNIARFQANLNNEGVLTIMAPKMREPKTMTITVTTQSDGEFLASVAKSFQHQQEEMAAQEQKEKKEEMERANQEEQEFEDLKALEKDNQTKNLTVKRKHKASMQSHFMIRRSMRTGRKSRTSPF